MEQKNSDDYQADKARAALNGVTQPASDVDISANDATGWDKAKSRIICALHEFSPDGPIEEGTDLSVMADSILRSLTADGEITIAPSTEVEKLSADEVKG